MDNPIPAGSSSDTFLLPDSYIIPYCERLTTGGEPINVVSNLAFLAAVIACWPLTIRVLSGSSRVTAPSVRHVALIAALILPLLIGAGSSAFHARPSQLTHMLDIVPICLFALCATLLFMNLLGWSTLRISVVIVSWLLSTVVAAQHPEILAHSLFYLPTALLLFVLVLMTWRSLPTNAITIIEHRLLTGMAVTFSVALCFRALDLQLCNLDVSQQPIEAQVGTHWMWHILTATTCVLCLHLLLRLVERRSRYNTRS